MPKRPPAMKRRGAKGAGKAPDGECDPMAASPARDDAPDGFRPARTGPHPRSLWPHGRGGEMARLCDGFQPRGRDLLGLSPRFRATRLSPLKTPHFPARKSVVEGNRLFVRLYLSG